VIITYQTKNFLGLSHVDNSFLGVSGESETLDVSRTPRGPLRNLSTFFFLLFSPGQRVGWL
jgi:hypothetical protein